MEITNNVRYNINLAFVSLVMCISTAQYCMTFAIKVKLLGWISEDLSR